MGSESRFILPRTTKSLPHILLSNRKTKNSSIFFHKTIANNEIMVYNIDVTALRCAALTLFMQTRFTMYGKETLFIQARFTMCGKETLFINPR